MVSQEAQARCRFLAAAPTGIPKEFFNQMKRSLAVLVALASGIVLTAAAQTPATPGASPTPVPAKVAVIAFQAAVGQTNEFQRNFADLQKKYEPRHAQLKTMQDEVDGLEKQLQATADKLSDSERANKAKIIDDKKKQAQRFAEDAQNDLTSEMNELYSGVATKVYDVLTAYAQQQGYTLVVDASEPQQQTPLVLYATQNTDITKVIVDAYNVKSGVPPPPAQLPSAPGPKAPGKPAGSAAH